MVWTAAAIDSAITSATVRRVPLLLPRGVPLTGSDPLGVAFFGSLQKASSPRQKISPRRLAASGRDSTAVLGASLAVDALPATGTAVGVMTFAPRVAKRHPRRRREDELIHCLELSVPGTERLFRAFTH